MDVPRTSLSPRLPLLQKLTLYSIFKGMSRLKSSELFTLDDNAV